jgi:hypothetical protein
MSCHIVRREGETGWDFLALAENVGSELLAGAVGHETPTTMLGVLEPMPKSLTLHRSFQKRYDTEYEKDNVVRFQKDLVNHVTM